MSTTKLTGTIKTISMDGYVKVKVGTKHHLADSNGYAYEHRKESYCSVLGIKQTVER